MYNKIPFLKYVQYIAECWNETFEIECNLQYVKIWPSFIQNMHLNSKRFHICRSHFYQIFELSLKVGFFGKDREIERGRHKILGVIEKSCW